MSLDLKHAVDECLKLDRDLVEKSSHRWSWESAWEIFRNNLVEKD